MLIIGLYYIAHKRALYHPEKRPNTTLQLALEEMEATGAYDYAVVQATESSAGFYDRMGFVRVGALARYVMPGVDYRKAETVAYRHFTGPDEDVAALDASIMMAIRLRPGSIPRRVLFKHGGIYSNLGTKITVCLEHAGECDESVKSTTPNSPSEDAYLCASSSESAGAVAAAPSPAAATAPSPAASEKHGLRQLTRSSPGKGGFARVDTPETLCVKPLAAIGEVDTGAAEDEAEKDAREVEARKLLGSGTLIGPNASAELLKTLQLVIGRPEFEELTAAEMSKEVKGKEASDGREGRRASEFAKRRLSLWLAPKEADKSWELYGTPPALEENANLSRAGSVMRDCGEHHRGNRRCGRGRPPAGGRSRARAAEGRIRGVADCQREGGARVMSASKTPRLDRKRKSSVDAQVVPLSLIPYLSTLNPQPAT